ncbi:MAG: trypsin-like serine protease [Verrucomicrobiales bacterium]|nr:trypsin-like serine protease [Verrucomicrobiales bacterium]
MTPLQPCDCKSSSSSPPDTVPVEAFNALKRQLTELSEIVHGLAVNQAAASPSPAADSTRSLVRSSGDSLDQCERSSPAALALRSTRIIGGEETNRFPHCAFIGRRTGSARPEEWSWFCTGVLINPRVVLSAAHCQPSAPDVVALNSRGLHDLGNRVEKIGILKSIVPDRYGRTGRIANYDIAIYILESPAGTAPVNAASASDLQNARQVTLAGFGRDDISSSRGFGVKREVTVDIRSLRRGHENLDREEALYGFESDDEFVAGSPVMDSCNGDSGGPAYIADPRNPNEWLVAGLTSRSTADSLSACGDGGVYTRIDSHWDWIVEVAKKFLR